ncbi:MAG: hypothetical protein ACLQVL_22305 [Terriglobia bacterium]
MFVAVLILMVSTGLFFFYFQVACQNILRQRYSQEYFRTIANANCLEFPLVRKAIEDSGAPVEFSRLKMALKCDFLALTYLLKNAANVNQRYTRDERLLILYFRVQFVCLVARHWLRLGESSAALTLTVILQYFANVVGERITKVRFGDLTVSDFFNL